MTMTDSAPKTNGLPYPVFNFSDQVLMAPLEYALVTHVLRPTGEHDLPHTNRLGYTLACNGTAYFATNRDVAARSVVEFSQTANACPECWTLVNPPAVALVPIVKGEPLHGSMRRFEMVRHIDSSGVSGTGLVCWGVEYPDGRVSTRWAQSEFGRQTSAWDCIEDVVSVHGHKGNTELRWLDPA